MSNIDDPHTSKSIQAVGGALAAGAGGLIGGAEGAAVGAALTVPATDLSRVVWEQLSKTKRRNIEQLLEAAAAGLDDDLRSMLGFALAREDTSELLAQVLDAATQTLNRQKIDALARALENGLRDDAAQVDYETLVVRALADLEPIHVKVLAVVAEMGRVSLADISRRTAIPPTILDAVLAVLGRNHLVEEDTDFESAFGQRLASGHTIAAGDDPCENFHRAVTPFGRLAAHRLDPRVRLIDTVD